MERPQGRTHELFGDARATVASTIVYSFVVSMPSGCDELGNEQDGGSVVQGRL